MSGEPAFFQWEEVDEVEEFEKKICKNMKKRIG